MSRPARTAVGIVALALVMALAACGERPHEVDASRPAPAAVATDAGSIYALDLALVDAAGRTTHLADLRGQTLIAAMMYTSCTSVCPRVTEDMKTIERQLSERDKRDVTFVLFSLDPGRDTPDALRRFSAAHRLDGSRWRLFAESEDGSRELAAVLGVKYRPDQNGDIAHSAMIVVIDRDGIVRHRQLGLVNDQRELIATLASLHVDAAR